MVKKCTIAIAVFVAAIVLPALADDGAQDAIAKYLERSNSALEVERIVSRYDHRDSSVSAELQRLFDAAHKEAGDSQATKDALDAHWLTLNRCFSVPGTASRYEKNRLHSQCGADLSAEKARVELAWRRAASGS